MVLSEDYSSFYIDITPDLFLFGEENESMIETESSSFGLSTDKLDDASEIIILFKWDGNTENNIEDVDYFIWGGIQGAVDKTGEGNYVEDTQADEQLYFGPLIENFSGNTSEFQRIMRDLGKFGSKIGTGSKFEVYREVQHLFHKAPPKK